MNNFSLFTALSLSLAVTIPSNAQTAKETESLMRFGKPLASVVEGERGNLQLDNPLKGKVVQGLWVFAEEKDRFYPTYLILHELKSLASDDVSTLTFPVTRPKPLYEVVWEPQFSPDGRYIVFKYGVPTSFDLPYALFVFDTVTQELRQVTSQDVSYNQISWSPDGKYIAYITGGDALGDVNSIRGDETLYTGPLRLVVCEWRTGRKQVVATNDALRGPLKWTAPHTLVYSALETQLVGTSQQEYSKLQTEKKPTTSLRHLRPNVYGYSIEEGRSRLLFEDGFRPTPSQNGEWIAFFGSETPKVAPTLKEDWLDNPVGMALSVIKKDGSERTALNLEEGTYPFVNWLPDGKHLLTIKQIKFGKLGRAQIKEWNIETGKFRIVAELTAEDFKSVPRSAADPQFLPLYLSSDGQQLVVAVSEAVGRDPLLSTGMLLLSKTTLQNININSGVVKPIAHTFGDSGLDWHQ